MQFLETSLGLPVIWLYPLLALCGVLVLVPPARFLALKFGFVDAPGGRKKHEEPVPPVGGLVIFPVFFAAALLSGIDLQVYWPLFFALALLLVTGVLDDMFHVGAWVKFAAQIMAALIVVVIGDARLYQLGDLFGFGKVGLDFMSIPFSVAAVTLLLNSINLMDGLDGLASGKSLIVLFWLMVACALVGAWAPLGVMAIMAGALLGFLFYNMRHPLRSRACIFLGDAGSLSLGLFLAWFCIELAQEPSRALVPIQIAWIVALPIIDACGQFYRRVRAGKHPFAPDRGHFHHHFIEAGFPVRLATPMILSVAFAFGAIGVLGLLAGVPQVVLTLGWIVLLFSHMAMSDKPARFVGFLAKIRAKCG